MQTGQDEFTSKYTDEGLVKQKKMVGDYWSPAIICRPVDIFNVNMHMCKLIAGKTNKLITNLLQL